MALRKGSHDLEEWVPDGEVLKGLAVGEILGKKFGALGC
jgi:hypothetical protein